MRQSAAPTVPSCPRSCTSYYGAGTGRGPLEGTAAATASALVKHCATVGLQRLFKVREEVRRLFGCIGPLQSSVVCLKQKVAERMASHIVACMASTCLVHGQVPRSNREAVSSPPAGGSPLNRALPPQSARISVVWVDCRDSQAAQTPQQQRLREGEVGALSMEMRKNPDIQQPPIVFRDCKEASCGVAPPPHGESSSVEDPGQLSEIGSAPKQLPNGVARNTSTAPTGVPEDKEKWMESYQRLAQQCANHSLGMACDYIRRHRELFEELSTLLSSARLPRWQRDGLNFAFIALQQEHEKALQQLSSEIGKARSSVNLMKRDYDVSEELEAMVTAEGVEEQAGPSIELNLLQHALLRLFGAYLAFVSSR